jgi:hypothetical protein
MIEKYYYEIILPDLICEKYYYETILPDLIYSDEV